MSRTGMSLAKQPQNLMLFIFKKSTWCQEWSLVMGHFQLISIISTHSSNISMLLGSIKNRERLLEQSKWPCNINSENQMQDEQTCFQVTISWSLNTVLPKEVKKGQKMRRQVWTPFMVLEGNKRGRHFSGDGGGFSSYGDDKECS